LVAARLNAVILLLIIDKKDVCSNYTCNEGTCFIDYLGSAKCNCTANSYGTFCENCNFLGFYGVKLKFYIFSLKAIWKYNFNIMIGIVALIVLIISLIILVWAIKKMKNRIKRNTNFTRTRKNKKQNESVINYESAVANSTLIIQSNIQTSKEYKLPTYDEFIANKP